MTEATVDAHMARYVLICARCRAAPELASELKLGQYTHRIRVPRKENRSELYLTDAKKSGRAKGHPIGINSSPDA